MRLKSDEQDVLFALSGGDVSGCQVREVRRDSILRKFSAIGFVKDGEITANGERQAKKQLTRRLAERPSEPIEVSESDEITETEPESEQASGDIQGPQRSGLARRTGRAKYRKSERLASGEPDESGSGPATEAAERSDDSGGDPVSDM